MRCSDLHSLRNKGGQKQTPRRLSPGRGELTYICLKVLRYLSDCGFGNFVIPCISVICHTWSFFAVTGIDRFHDYVACRHAWIERCFRCCCAQPLCHRILGRFVCCQLTVSLIRKEVLAFSGETYIVSVDEFSATCNWQVVGVQVEQNRTLRKAHQSGEPIWHCFTQFVKKTSVSDSVVCCC